MAGVTSSKPSKQRLFRYNAPLHIKRKFLSAHLAKELRKQFKMRSLPLRKGDKVMVMKGKFKKKVTKVAKIDIRRQKVMLEDIKRKKSNGKEVYVPIASSNLMIIEPVMEDKKRKINRKTSQGEKA